MSDELEKYRSDLLRLEQQSQEQFDKTLLTLSSGAIGVSLVFGVDLLGSPPWVSATWILVAWSCWSLCLTATLASFWTSKRAARLAVLDLDAGKETSDRTGRYDRITEALGILAPAFFIAGVASLLNFMFQTLGD